MALERLSPEEVKALLESEEEYVYLDVRTAEEFAAGHVPGARNVPIMERGPMGMTPNPEFLAVVEANYSKDAKIVTGCLRGGRSMNAAQVLIASGFSEVKDMRGGFDGEMGPGGMITFDGWTRRGLPVADTPDDGATYDEHKSKV